MRTHLLTTTAVMALLSASTVATRAQTNWTGAISSDWFTAGNWTGGVPTLGTSATIGTLSNPTVVGAAGAVAQSLVVGQFGAGNLAITNGGTLITATGAVIGQLTRGDVTVTGPGSQWENINGGIQVGGGSIGTLTVADGGKVSDTPSGTSVGGRITVGGGGGSFSGALIGDGSVTSTLTQINAGGFLVPGQGIVPGQGGTPGAMGFIGNLAFQSGAFYIVQVNPLAASTSNVLGTASLAGTVVANFAPGSYVSRSYTILTAAGGVTGTFDRLATLGLPTGFGTSLSYTGNTALLNIRAQLVPEGQPPTGGLIPGGQPIPGLPFPLPDQAPPLPLFNENQLNVGHAIDNFFNNGGALPPAFVSLFGLSGSNLTNALTQLSGEVATGAERAAFQLTNSFLTSLTDPIGCGGVNASALLAISPYACARGGLALPFAPEEQASLPTDIALAYASIFKAPPKPIFQQHWSSWGSAYGGSNTSNGVATVGSNNVTTDIFGFAAGMDYNFTPDLLAGFALAGAGTTWKLANGLGTGRSDAFQVGARVISWFGPAYVKAALAFTNNWFTTNRSALGDQLTANFDGQSYGGRVEGGYRYFVLPALGVTPYGALQAQEFHTPSYSETDLTGIGFGLSHPAMNAADVRSELGARFDDPTLLYGKPLILFGRLAWAHDFVNNPALSAGFQALPGASFTVNGAPIPHDSALTTAGAELFFSASWSLLAKFEGEFGNGSQTYAGTGTLRYTW